MSRSITALLALVAVTALQGLLMLQAFALDIEPNQASSKSSSHGSTFAPCNRSVEISHPRSRSGGPPEPELRLSEFLSVVHANYRGTAFGAGKQSELLALYANQRPLWLLNRSLLI